VYRHVNCIAIVIVNYRTPELVKACLDSIANEQDADSTLKVYVGDAESGDGSTDIINRHIEERGLTFATCFDIGVNNGFAYGNNHIVTERVLDDPDIDYVYFLNPDTYVHPGAIAALVDALRTRPNAAVAGSRLENPDGSLRAYGFRFPSPCREFFRGARLPLSGRLFPASEIKIDNLLETRKVDWVNGASFMMPRQALDKVGLMDARYFLYFEEVDFMFRVRKAGLEVWHVSDSRVVHLQGAATGMRTDDRPKRSPAYWYHSRFRFFRASYGRTGAIAANLLFLLGDTLYRLHRTVRLKPLLDPPYLWRDMLTHGFVPAEAPERP